MFQRKRRCQKTWIQPSFAWALIAVLLVACSDKLPFQVPIPVATDVPITATIDLSTGFSGAFASASHYLDAINQQNYTAAFAQLDSQSQKHVQAATQLAGAYANARTTATAITVTYTLQDNVAQQDFAAIMTMTGTWQTTLLGSFSATSTLSMTTDGTTWAVAWSRDLILPGMANGVLTLRRDVPLRGVIYAADGSALAVQNELMTLGVRRDEITDSAEEQAMLSALSKLTGLSTDTIFGRYKDQPPEWFVPIADIDAATLSDNSALIQPFSAVSARSNYARAYPQGTLAPHVVGYVGPISPEDLPAYQARGYAGDEQVGLSGVEGYMDSTLAGQEGGSLQVVDSDGTVTTLAEKPFVPGSDITLSISPTVQLSVQKILGERRGAAVVLNARDQSVFAMASYPTFDNSVLGELGNSNARQKLIGDPGKPLLNRATQGVYPAGSTFKIVTMSAGMAESVTAPSDVFYDPGYWDGLGVNYRKTCWLRSGHGRLTLQDGLTASCDVVFYTVGKRLDDKGEDILAQYGRQFGFGAPTGIELSGEASGIMPDPEWKKMTLGEAWTPGDTVNLAIGQGYMLATPLQVTQMTAAVAANGTLYQPHVVASIESRGTGTPKAIAPQVVRELPITTEQLQSIQKGMAGVTTNARIGTTTFRFADFDYYFVDGNIVAGKSLTSKQRTAATKFVVAGKSGTAQAPGPQDKPFAWFTAYAPADNPQIVVTVMLENAGEGSVVAAPLVRQIIESYFGLPISPTPHDVLVTD